MRIYIVTFVAFLATLLYVGSPLGSPEIGLTFPVYTRGLTALIGLGVEGYPGAFETQQFGSTTIYTDDVYRIQVTETPGRTRSIVRLRVEKHSGQPFGLSHVSVRVRIPRSGIQGIWYPSSDVSSSNVMSTDANHAIHDIADANYGVPYIAAASANSRNVFAMGFGRQDLSVIIDGDPVENGYYEFRLKATTARIAAVFEERFFISNDTSLSWFDTAATYADWVDALNGYRPFPVSERAYEPVYDTWYWSGDRVDEDLYLDTAKLASEVGAGLYLADAGWDAPAGEYDKWLDGRTGDYNPPPDKFTDLSKTFEAMRSEYNLGVQLWLQPFAVGRASSRYSRTRHLHIQIPQNYPSILAWPGLTYPPFVLPLGQNLESVNICPRVTGTHTYLRNLFTEMTTKYKPDGYWLDFIDGIATYCIAPHTHNYPLFGDGFRAALDTIKSTILASNPNAVVHFRAQYANLNNKSFANVWQSEDSPGDYDLMRVNALRLRPFSKGVVFASDQLYWPDSVDEATTAKFIMTSVMVGVPAFGLNLTYMPQSTYTMLKEWLRFYRMHKEDLAMGQFSPFGQLRVPNHKIEGAKGTFAYIRNLDFSELAAGRKTIYILNATDGNRFTGRVRGPSNVAAYSVQVFDRFLGAEVNPMKATVSRSGALSLNIAVEQGGMIVLTALEDKAAIETIPVQIAPRAPRARRKPPRLRKASGDRLP